MLGGILNKNLNLDSIELETRPEPQQDQDVGKSILLERHNYV